VSDWRSVFLSDWCIAYAQLLYHMTSNTGSFYLFGGSCFEHYSQFVSFSERQKNGQWFIVSYDSANKQKHHKSHRMQ